MLLLGRPHKLQLLQSPSDFLGQPPCAGVRRRYAEAGGFGAGLRTAWSWATGLSKSEAGRLFSVVATVSKNCVSATACVLLSSSKELGVLKSA